jgi:hypothetical protein
MYGAEQKREKKCCVLLTKAGGWPLYKAYTPHLVYTVLGLIRHVNDQP